MCKYNPQNLEIEKKKNNRKEKIMKKTRRKVKYNFRLLQMLNCQEKRKEKWKKKKRVSDNIEH